MFISSMLMCCH